MSAPGILFRNCRVFDGNDLRFENGEVLVLDGTIAQISERSIRTQTVGRTVDARGRTLMPGLIDAHFHAVAAHLDLRSLDEMPATLLAQHARALLEASLQRGFTTVRDAGGADAGLAMAVEHGLIAGPRIFFSGKALSQTGGHGDLRKGFTDTCAAGYSGRMNRVADGEAEVRKAAREELRQGATQIKLMLSGGVYSPADPIWMLQFADAEIRAAVEEAHSRRTYVMAHAHTPDAVVRAVEAGVRSIEHAPLLDERAAQAVRAHGAYIVPTLAIMWATTTFGKEIGLPAEVQGKIGEIWPTSREAISLAERNGVQLGFGTDLLGVWHQHQNVEFRLRREAQSSLSILRAATSVNAEILDANGRLGTIAPGAHADLILVDGDPIDDVTILADPQANIRFVMKAGVVYRDEAA